MANLSCSFVMDFPVQFKIPATEEAAAWAFRAICGFTKEVADDLAGDLMDAMFTEDCVVWMMENGENFTAELVS